MTCALSAGLALPAGLGAGARGPPPPGAGRVGAEGGAAPPPRPPRPPPGAPAKRAGGPAPRAPAPAVPAPGPWTSWQVTVPPPAVNGHDTAATFWLPDERAGSKVGVAGGVRSRTYAVDVVVVNPPASCALTVRK